MKNWLTIIILIQITSCNPTDRRDCVCNLDDIATHKTDSTVIQQEKTPLNIDLEGKITSKIKKAFDSEVDGKVNVSFKEINLHKVLEVVSNEMPEHNDVILFFRIKKIIYCEYYERLCRDTSINNSELNQILNKKLDEIDNALESYFSFNEKKEPQQPSKIANQKNPLTFIIIPKEQLLIKFIERETELRYSESSFDYNILISSSGEIRAINEKNTLFQYSGGQIELIINNNRCHIFKDIQISESMSLGNPLEPLKKSIQSKIENAIMENTNKIGSQILNCLQ